MKRNALIRGPITAARDSATASARPEQDSPSDADVLDTLRARLRKQPNDPKRHDELGVHLVRLGQLDEAVACFSAALKLNYNDSQVHQHLAQALADQSKSGQAANHWRHVLTLEPTNVRAMAALADAIFMGPSAGEACVLLRQACRLKPDDPDLLNGLGQALLAAGRFEEAEGVFLDLLRLEPHFAAGHVNLSTVYKQQGRLPEALACCEHALRLDPTRTSTKWNRALILLQMGELEFGFAEYEWRWTRGAASLPDLGKPQWQGESLEGKTLLLTNEQGLGDSVQFIRYAALARDRGATVLFRCQAPLLGLLSSTEGLDAVIPENEPLPPFDYFLPLMSAPQRFGTTRSNLPAGVPYIRLDREVVAHWRDKMAGLAGFRVGLAWQGNPHHQLDRFRSMLLSSFARFKDLQGSGLSLLSVQRGPGSEQLDDVGNRRLNIVEILGRSVDTRQDWVDTAIAHVAGALGKPVWLAVSTIPDWRWMQDRHDSVWYPSMTIFRQRELGGWDTVVTQMHAALAEILNEGQASQARLDPADRT